MLSVVDEALADVDALVDEFNLDDQLRYNWTPAEDQMLRRWYGRTGRSDLATRVTAVLQQQTGDVAASRSIVACAGRVQQLGLSSYQPEPGEMMISEAIDFVGVESWQLYRAVADNKIPSVRRGKYCYITMADLSRWYVDYRELLIAQGELLEALEQTETVSKPDAWEIVGGCETQMTRYLQCGIIIGYKMPAECKEVRWEWLVERKSIEQFIEARAGGRLKDMIAENEAYQALVTDQTKQIRALRAAGRLSRSEDLSEPKSKFFPGYCTVQQVANYVGLTAKVIYINIQQGNLAAKQKQVKSKMRFGIEKAEAVRFRRWLETRKPESTRWNNQQRENIADAGLLTTDDVGERFGVTREAVCRWIHYGRRGAKLPARRWGRYLVCEPADVDRFAELARLTPKVRSGNDH